MLFLLTIVAAATAVRVITFPLTAEDRSADKSASALIAELVLVAVASASAPIVMSVPKV